MSTLHPVGKYNASECCESAKHMSMPSHLLLEFKACIPANDWHPPV